MKSDGILRRSGAEWSLLEELLKTEDDSRVGQSEISQPATTAIQIATVDLLATWGIQPSYVIGHSSGEIAAAYTAGALDHDAAIQM
jgi:acyl transferase domain-containing protein